MKGGTLVGGPDEQVTPTAAAVHIYMHGLRSVDWVNNHRNVRTQVFETFKYLCTYTLFWCHIQILVYLNMISDQSNIAVSPEQGM